MSTKQSLRIMKNARIIIVGAGISGISTAASLIENGFKNLVILEAENRIGGRVWTVPFSKNVVDMGAQWCHGEKGNIVYDLVKDHNVLEGSKIEYPKVRFLRSTGNVDGDKCGRLMNLLFSILERCKDGNENDKKWFSNHDSLGSYVVEAYKEALKTSEFIDIDEDTSCQVLDYFHKFENSIEASDSWFETSGSGYLEYFECDGHPLLNWKDKGYASVIDFITKKKPNPANALDVESKILLNKEVVYIDWFNPSRSHLVVKCIDGTSYDADHVVVTTSLGVLKENYKTLFSPQLPQLKINAIEGLSIGSVDKIFVEFERPFWDKEWAGFSLLWTEEDAEKIRDTSNAWLENVFGFYTVDYQPNILCGWIGGPSAREMEKLDDATVLKGCLTLFEKFLGNQIKWTKPIAILRSNWYSNKHFRGSYSFRSITTDLLKTDAKSLAHPLHDALGKPTLLFAGEATSDHFFSTVHGAFEAGLREAKRLTDFYASLPISIRVPKSIAHYDAIILGAGISGLGAGETLKKSGMNFVILEADNRVGGRINTSEMIQLKVKNKTPIMVDAGAQWLHGRNNELFKVADTFNLILPEVSQEAEGDYIREDGFIFDEYLVKKVDFVFGQILEECEQLKGQKILKYPSSIEEFVNEKFTKFVDSLQTGDEKMQAIQLLDWHRKFQMIDNSCLHFNDISAKDFGNYSFNGESCQTHINIKNGMSRVVDILYQSLKNDIRLNSQVKLIHWKSEGFSNKIKILCKDGSIYTSDSLICTLPLGVLKQHHLEMFTPMLPINYREVIEKIGYGTINKIFLHFSEKWWPLNWNGLQLIRNNELSDNSHWTNYISGFDVMFPEPKNTLIGWIGGAGGIAMEKLDDKDIVNQCMKLIRQFMKNPNIPDPSNFFISKWKSNELARGSYSFTSKKTDHIHDWEKVLSKPLISAHPRGRQNVIAFAGEHCHQKYFSTVHGAFESGIEQAEKVLKFHDGIMKTNSKL